MEKLKLINGGLADFQNAVHALKDFGRYEDDTLAHVATGETIIPMEVFEKNPQLRDQVFKSMTDLGIDPTQYIVGSNFNSINPVTGQPEFFLKKLFKKIKKAAPVLLPIAASFIPGVGPLAMAGAGFAGGKIAGQDTKQALLSGILAGLGGKFAGGTQAAQAGQQLGGKSLGSQLFKGISKEGLGSLFSQSAPTFTNPATQAEIYSGANTAELANNVSKTVQGGGDNFSKMLNIFRKGGEEGAKFSPYRIGAGLTGTAFLKDLLFPEKIEEEEYIDTNVYPGDFGQLLELAKARKYSPGSNIVPFQLAGGGYMGGYNGVKADAESLTASDNIDSRIMKNLQYEKMAPGMMGYAAGGIAHLREGGFPYATAKRAKGGVSGPGTGTSDDIPAYLSNGEFVVTAKAVKNAGGSRPMYDMMDHLEKGGKLSPASRGK